MISNAAAAIVRDMEQRKALLKGEVWSAAAEPRRINECVPLKLI